MLSRFRALLVVAALVAPVPALAFPIAAPGTEGFFVIVGSTSDVIATFEGNSGAYSNDLYLENGAFGFVFNNHTSVVGSTVNLGSYAIGTELLFRLNVTNTGDNFYSGPGSRNADGFAHARVENNWMPNTTLVSFEDLFNGPFDFNDLSFSFTNTVSSQTGNIAEPDAIGLLGLGLAGLGFAVRRRRPS